MAKEPRVGFSKTRLSPPLSPSQAALLSEALLRDTITLASSLDGFALAIAVSPPKSTAYFKGISPPETIFLPVDCKDIGDCLSQVTANMLNQGYQKVFALNADGPSLPAENILIAAELLDIHEIVLGPSADGGYYLIGTKSLYPDLFAGINWSTSSVFNETFTKIKRLGLSSGLLPIWYDIDTVEDLYKLHAELKQLPDTHLQYSRKILADLFPSGFDAS